LPNVVSGYTINRFCSSGLQAVADAASQIRLGQADVMIAAGTESMTAMSSIFGNKVVPNPAIFSDENIGIAYGMGLTAEEVASKWGITRDAQDAFALASHQKACAAIATGHFQAETSPYAVCDRLPDLASGQVRERRRTVEHDEGARADISLEKLAKLRPVFRAKGSVTAGNASQMSDGAGAVMLVSEKVLKECNLTPLARFAGYAVGGVAPEIMGIGPIAAIPRVLAQTGIRQDDLDWIELNEAFAAQALAVTRELGLNPEKINPLGGAIALGHPLGATGAIRTATLLHGLQRTGGKYGMVSMCIGTGMGAAGIFERV
jgi:acetyl-CoA acyltransferase